MVTHAPDSLDETFFQPIGAIQWLNGRLHLLRPNGGYWIRGTLGPFFPAQEKFWKVISFNIDLDWKDNNLPKALRRCNALEWNLSRIAKWNEGMLTRIAGCVLITHWIIRREIARKKKRGLYEFSKVCEMQFPCWPVGSNNHAVSIHHNRSTFSKF